MANSESMAAIIKEFNRMKKNSFRNDSFKWRNLTSSIIVTHVSPALIFYAISTLIILVVGIVGNSACIYVLINKRVLRQSSAQYFMVFCIFDILVLIFYVLPEWFSRAIYPISEFEIFRWNSIPGVCQLFLLLSYWLRLVSVWTLAAYSVDRYLGLRNTQFRQRLCGSHYNVKVLAFVTLTSLLISIWKPYISQSSISGSNHRLICGGEATNHLLNFIYDTIYACLMSVIPSILIVFMNCLIAAHIWNFRCRTKDVNVTRQDLVGLQFAVLMVLISSSFIFLSWPYFVVWIHAWWLHANLTQNSPTGRFGDLNLVDNAKLITRVMFYLHFGINFFLYSLASKYFKYQIKRIFSLRSLRNKTNEYYNHR